MNENTPTPLPPPALHPDRVYVHAEPDGTAYYRDRGAATRTESEEVTVSLGTLNWLTLARQKHLLVKLTTGGPASLDPYDRALLSGLVGLLDRVQDQAARGGHPVVWSGSVTDEP